MTRRTLIATLLAAILAPFRRAKAAPVVTADYWRDRMQEIVDRRTAEFGPSAAKKLQVSRFLAARMQQDVSPTPTRAIFGLCPKCGGLQCRCD